MFLFGINNRETRKFHTVILNTNVFILSITINAIFKKEKKILSALNVNSNAP